MLYLTYKIMWVICMIKKQETMILSEYAGIYDLVVPKDNMLRKINELIDFSFVYDKLLDKYCTNNGRNVGDICAKEIIDKLESITKTFVVRGNNDKDE